MLTRYIFRSLCALLVGFLLVSNPTDMTLLIVQIIGGLFVLSGLLAIIGFFNTRRELRRIQSLATQQDNVPKSQPTFLPMFPVVGIGSIALGALLIALPAQFVSILMYALGALLVLIGGVQIAVLIRYRKVVPIDATGFIIPAGIIAAGIFVILKPLEAASLPFTILGIAYIAYGVNEFFFGIRLYRLLRLIEAAPADNDITDADAIEIAEDEGEETPENGNSTTQE